MTINEAAARLQISPRSVRRLVADGTIPAYRPGPGGGKIVLDPADVEAYRQSTRTLGARRPRAELKHINIRPGR